MPVLTRPARASAVRRSQQTRRLSTPTGSASPTPRTFCSRTTSRSSATEPMRRRSWTPGRAILALALGVLVVVLVVFPIARLATVAWTEGRGTLRELAEPGLGRAVIHTILLAAAVTAAAVPMGTAAAMGLARADVPGRRAWRLALLLPIVVPDYVLGFSWTEAYGIGGFTDVLAGHPWPGVNSAVGVWAALTVGAVPLTYLVVAAGLSARAEPSLVRAARASGAGPAVVLWTITLP